MTFKSLCAASLVSLFIMNCQRSDNQVIPGAMQTELYTTALRGLRVALVANQTSIAGDRHLVDVLISEGIDIKVIFAPEHGFRNMADAGETISDGKDTQTGLPVISLYGNHRKPYANDLKEIDIVVFDIQDVGARFFICQSSSGTPSNES